MADFYPAFAKSLPGRSLLLYHFRGHRLCTRQLSDSSLNPSSQNPPPRRHLQTSAKTPPSHPVYPPNRLPSHLVFTWAGARSPALLVPIRALTTRLALPKRARRRRPAVIHLALLLR